MCVISEVSKEAKDRFESLGAGVAGLLSHLRKVLVIHFQSSGRAAGAIILSVICLVGSKEQSFINLYSEGENRQQLYIILIQYQIENSVLSLKQTFSFVFFSKQVT